MRTLLSTVVFFAATVLTAQPVFQAFDLTPEVGETFTLYPFQYDNTSVITETGVDYTWDFSSIVTSTPYELSVLANQGLPATSSFPAANRVLGNEASEFAYFEVTSNGIFIQGVDSPWATVVYDDDERTLAFPLTINTSWSDSFTAEITGPLSASRVGVGMGDVDGYGTLITPFGTYENVLRLNRTSDMVDTFEIDGQEGTTTFFTRTIQWYHASSSGPILSISFISTDGGPDMGTGGEFNFSGDPNTVTDLNLASLIALAPNPASDIIRLSLDASLDPVSYSVYDMSGRLITRWTPVLNAERQEFSVADLKPGYYSLLVDFQNGDRTSKAFVVQP